MKFELFSVSAVYEWWLDLLRIEIGDFDGALFFIYCSKWNGFDFDFLYARGLWDYFLHRHNLKSNEPSH